MLELLMLRSRNSNNRRPEILLNYVWFLYAPLGLFLLSAVFHPLIFGWSLPKPVRVVTMIAADEEESDAGGRTRPRTPPSELSDLLRTLRQPHQHQGLQTKLSELVAHGSVTSLEAYDALLVQALRMIPNGDGAPNGAANAGFVPDYIQRRADGSIVPPPETLYP